MARAASMVEAKRLVFMMTVEDRIGKDIEEG